MKKPGRSAFGPTVRALLFLPLLPFFQACGGTVHVKETKELTDLFNAIKQRNGTIASARAEREAREIKTLAIHKSADTPPAVTVDFDVVQAKAERVFARMMADSGQAFRSGDVVLPGRVTTHGQGMPLLDAVKAIVEPQGVQATMEGDTLVLDYAPRPVLAGGIDASTMTITRSVELRYIDTDAAGGLLDQIFPAPRPFNVGKVVERNAIYLTGTASAVQQAVDLLNRVDRYPKIVMLEALVIEFDSDAFETLSASLSGFQYKSISAGALNYAAAPMLQFTRNITQDNPFAYTAILNALFQQDKARLVSRPYIATLSGKQANINLTTNQYVVVQTPSAGAAVYTTQSIKAGVVMNITPIVAAGGVIRLQMTVEDSQFVPTQGNTAVEVNQDNASSFMTLLDGQTTIIGGMVVKRVSSSSSGLPWLRRIPLVNLLTSRQEATEHHSEVAIYLTPHIIDAPDMDLPLVNPHAMEMDPFWGNFTPTERLGFQQNGEEKAEKKAAKAAKKAAKMNKERAKAEQAPAQAAPPPATPPTDQAPAQSPPQPASPAPSEPPALPPIQPAPQPSQP